MKEREREDTLLEDKIYFFHKQNGTEDKKVLESSGSWKLFLSSLRDMWQ